MHCRDRAWRRSPRRVRDRNQPRLKPARHPERQSPVKLLVMLSFAVLAAGCGTPTVAPSRTSTQTLTAASPTPVATLVFLCPAGDPRGPTPPPGGCSAEERAALAAVIPLGYPVARIEIVPNGWPCGIPFSPPVACLALLRGPAAYVTFVGTDKVAALTFTTRPDGSLAAAIAAFETPRPTPTPGR